MRAGVRFLCAAAALAALLGFVAFFDAKRAQARVDGLWPAALVLAHAAFCCGRRPRGPRALGRRDLLPVAVLLPLFAAAWLPFHDNWRWAYTGDSPAWFGFGLAAARGGLWQSALNVSGVDGHFTSLHSLAANAWMFVAAPTFFWHRVSKLTFSCLSLLAIYIFHCVHSGRLWASAVLACVAVNSVWLWFSYASYGHIDSHLFAYASLTLATLVPRRPERLALWALAGTCAGLSLFFTQTAWAEVSAAGAVLLVSALRTRRLRSFATCGATFLIAAAPLVVQWRELLAMGAAQSHPLLEPDYLWRIFVAILRLPLRAAQYEFGTHGAFLRAPLDWLYVGGVLLAVVGGVAPLRRLLRIPRLAPAVLALLLWDALLMTLTNNQYADPSTKRTYHLVPLQVFLALTPLMVLGAWPASRPVRAACAAATAACIGVYAAANLWLTVHPQPFTYGYNVCDGLVELRQRHPDRRVVLYSTRQNMEQWLFGPESHLEMIYHLSDTVEIVDGLTREALAHIARRDPIVCYETGYGAEQFRTVFAPLARSFRRLRLLNSEEIVCFDPL